MQEMSSMLVCLQKHEFLDQMCSAEIKAFKKCQAQAQVRFVIHTKSNTLCTQILLGKSSFSIEQCNLYQSFQT